MPVDQGTLRIVIMSVLGICMIANAYFLYAKYQSISVCRNQHAQLDALETQINNIKK
jgi:hypothetical protein